MQVLIGHFSELTCQFWKLGEMHFLRDTKARLRSPSWGRRALKGQVPGKVARRNIDNLRYADDTTLMAETEEELKSLLKKVEEEK